MQQAHNIYLTKFQQQSLYMGAKDERVIAARRVGKTDGLVAPYVWTASNSMPGMLGAWVAVSRQQGFGKTIPSTMAAMERMFGFTQGITPPLFISQKRNLISFLPHHQSSSAHRQCSDL